mmetsp:Transcript_50001/g.119386  ORF Transcript_50001/g.119386 Transcript_50001/m.119386 type:complete len:211 (+) Transcript_50001:185-817(+)
MSFGFGHLHGLGEVVRRLIEAAIRGVHLAQAMVGALAHLFEAVLSKLVIRNRRFLPLRRAQVVLQTDAAGLQVALGSRGNAQVANSEALSVLGAHAVGILYGMLVMDRRMLRQAHGLKDDAQVGVSNQSSSAVSQLQVLVVILDRLVVLPHLEAVDAQTVVGQRLALGVLGGNAQGQELLVLLNCLIVGALVVVHHPHLMVGLQGLVHVA